MRALGMELFYSFCKCIVSCSALSLSLSFFLSLTYILSLSLLSRPVTYPLTVYLYPPLYVCTLDSFAWTKPFPTLTLYPPLSLSLSCSFCRSLLPSISHTLDLRLCLNPTHVGGVGHLFNAARGSQKANVAGLRVLVRGRIYLLLVALENVNRGTELVWRYGRHFAW